LSFSYIKEKLEMGKHGKGKYKYENDKIGNYGTYFYNNGDKYQAELKDDVKH